MTKRILAGLMALCLMLCILPAQVRAENGMTEVRVLDQVTSNYSVENVDTGVEHWFSLDVPQGGAAVLVFYSTGCTNSQNFFSQLNQQDWAFDSRVKIYALESSGSASMYIRQFRQNYASGLTENVEWYRAKNTWMMSGCWRACGMTSSTVTYPVVAVLSQTGTQNYFRWIGDGVRDAAELGELVLGMIEAPKEEPPVETREMVDITVAGMVDYDEAEFLLGMVNQLRWENGAQDLNWNSRLTELAMKWAAGMPLQEENPNLFAYPYLPDGTDIAAYVSRELPECKTVFYVAAGSEFNAISKLERSLSNVIREDITQIGIGCYKTEFSSNWVVFLTSDLEQMDTVTQTGWEYRDYTFPCPVDALPVFEGPLRFNSSFYIGETDITEIRVKSRECIYDDEGVLRPWKISEHIYDPETGVLIATAGVWKDGKITITGVAPGEGVLEVWAYEGQETPMTHPIHTYGTEFGGGYQLTTEVIGNGTVELSTTTSNPNKLVRIFVQPDHRWELKSLYVEQDGMQIDPVYMALSRQDDGSYTFRMPSRDVHIVAEFSYITEYPIRHSSTGMGEVNASEDAEPGTTVYIGIRPEWGWMIGSVEWDGEPADWSWGDGDYITFTMPEHAVGLHVTFVEDPNAWEGITEDHIWWSFDGVGLWINCEGELNRTINGAEGPWAKYLDHISILHIGSDDTSNSPENITAIGNHVFANFPKVEIVNIYQHVMKIGRKILQDFPNLWTINIDGDPECHPDAFLGYAHLLGGHEHEFVVIGVVEPACTEEGYTRILCDCGQEGRSKTVAPLGHSYRNGICSRCGAADPEYAPKNPFADVKAGKWYEAPVLWAVERGITAGTSATEFSPDDPCTRAQIVTFIWRAKGSPEPASTENPFTDVKAGKYYYKAVLWAVENGITSGTSATTFGPDDPCTRAQVATFLWRAEGQPEPETTDNPFADVKASKYFFKPVLWAVENEITLGTSAGKFSPDDECTRAQIVTFLYRAMAEQ